MLGKALTTAAAGNAAGEATYVEDAFSTYLYTGTGSTQTITNGIDLDAKGGLVWVKARNFSSPHILVDTERGVNNNLRSHQTIAEYTQDTVTAFNSNGFSVTGANGDVGTSGNDYASWTFAKQEKFFDVVTWTGDGTGDRTIPHNLGSAVGCWITKFTNYGSGWFVWHRGLTSSDYRLLLNGTSAESSGSTGVYWSQAPDENNIYITNQFNTSGREYVAYLFAHNDGDGIFGETGDQDIIKCGSYTGTGAVGNEVTLGFEPQWVMIKSATAAANWYLFDNMRGIHTGSNDNVLWADDSRAEFSSDRLAVSATGFTLTNASNTNTSGHTYIYIAIRRGPMKTPESGTEVFDANAVNGSTAYTNGFPADSIWIAKKAGDGSNTAVFDRLRGEGRALKTSGTNAETTYTTEYAKFDDSEGSKIDYWPSSDALITWNFRRAPGFFDVVAYEGNGTNGRAVSHNLGVTPELMIVKSRDQSASRNWQVYHKDVGYTDRLYLNENFGLIGNTHWHSEPDDSSFYYSSYATGNGSGENYIAYLFATVPGVSKVGSYTGNGTSQTIDCGFSTGARFVLIKRTDSTGDWHVYDSERGIVAGNDPRLELNTTDAEDTGSDDIDPVSSGFSVTNNADVNTNSASYIFLAIA